MESLQASVEIADLMGHRHLQSFIDTMLLVEEHFQTPRDRVLCRFRCLYFAPSLNSGFIFLLSAGLVFVYHRSMYTCLSKSALLTYATLDPAVFGELGWVESRGGLWSNTT